MQRKDPVIDDGIMELTDRVRLTWRDVRELAKDDSLPGDDVTPNEEPQLAPMPTFHSNESVKTLSAPCAEQPPEISHALTPQNLTPEMITIIANQIIPAVEQTVRENLIKSLELSLNNAFSRVRSDMERAISASLHESIKKELTKIDLSTLKR